MPDTSCPPASFPENACCGVWRLRVVRGASGRSRRGGLLGLEEGLRELPDAGGRVRVFGDTDLAEDVAAVEFAEALASSPMPCSTPEATRWPASEMVECTATRAPAW
jgi:hypothetical protein